MKILFFCCLLMACAVSANQYHPYFGPKQPKLMLDDREIVLHKDEANWFAAYHLCQLEGMQLLQIHTIEENTKIFHFLEKYGIQRVWTAGTDLGKEGEWQWMTTGEKPKISQWAFSNPDNFMGVDSNGENCLSLDNQFRERPYDNWVDMHCARKMAYICETMPVQGKEEAINVNLPPFPQMSHMTKIEEKPTEKINADSNDWKNRLSQLMNTGTDDNSIDKLPNKMLQNERDHKKTVIFVNNINL